MLQATSRSAYAAFRRASLSEATRLVSVDVFDTLLLRTTKPETARFLDIGSLHLRVLREHHAAIRLTARDMLILRLMAARAAYRNARHVDGIREPGYAYLARILIDASGVRSSPELIDRLAEEEISYEASVLAANRVLVDILQRAKSAGKRVICVSDMYLGGRHIDTLLRKCGVECFDAVYASSDFGVGKASRRLFDEVLAIEGVLAAEMVHCGDNHTSDYRQAKEVGIRAFHTPRARHWRAVERTRRRLFGWQHRLSSL